ncbi:unnamed protein product [Paramecium octaurelia]|uniref:Uncharacterized protein n=1 Tax=Paramecium octaurelia TaxID=43137 RepID=A0A8S1VRC3_PAROT|nr:unnamed protein product [Paramecium octaurelia]
MIQKRELVSQIMHFKYSNCTQGQEYEIERDDHLIKDYFSSFVKRVL